MGHQVKGKPSGEANPLPPQAPGAAQPEEAHDQLQRLVEERTAALALANARLQEEADQRRRAEQALRASDSRFRAIVEKSFEAVALIAAEGAFRYLTPSVFAILGYAPEELQGRNGFDLVHPEDQPGLGGLLAQLAQIPGGHVTTCYRARHKDGSWRWLELRGTNLLADPGVQAVVVNFRDVSAHKEAEANLRLLLESTDEGIYRIDLQGRCTFRNRAGAALAHKVREVLDQPEPSHGCVERQELPDQTL